MNQKDTGMILWFTGRSMAGKTTLVTKLYPILEKNSKIQILDEDVLMPWLVSGVYFNKNVRRKVLSRIIEIAKLLSNQNITVLVAAVTRYNEFRDIARKSLGNRYHEIYVNCSLETCLKRNPNKSKIRSSWKKIQSNFKTYGNFEEPVSADLVIDTEHQSIDESLKEISEFVDSLIIKR